jgi:hypothetical protein
MADALARLGISRFHWALVRLHVVVVRTTSAHQIIRVAGAEHERNDDTEERGAEKAHEAGELRACPQSVKSRPGGNARGGRVANAGPLLGIQGSCAIMRG